MSRSTRSSDPGPRQGTTGTPRIRRLVTWASRESSRIRQARAETGPYRRTGARGSVSIDDHASSRRRARAAPTEDHRRDERREHHDERIGGDAGARSPVRRAGRWPGPTSMPASVSSSRLSCGGAGRRCRGGIGPDDVQRDAIAAAQEVLAERPGGAHREIEAARRAVETLALAEVVAGVDDEHDVAFSIGVGGGHVQHAGAQRHRPVDPSQPVAELERPDAGEFRAVAGRRRLVQADQTSRVGERGAGVEHRRKRYRHQRQGVEGRRTGAERSPAARRRDRVRERRIGDPSAASGHRT